SGGKSQGGFAPTVTYGPYEMAPGETIHIVMVFSADGMPYKAQVEIGNAFKRNGTDESFVIEYDANGDGTIDCQTFDYTTFDTGNECMTKNQWVMTARDSLFKNFIKARDVWNASEQMSKYPIAEPPRPPASFTVDGKPDQIELRWELPEGGPNRVGWEVYRTSNITDNLPYTCLAGNGPECLSPMLAAGATSYDDKSAIRGTSYFYYVQAVGENQPVDPKAIAGTPGGLPLKSSLYYTLTYIPTNLKRPPFGNTALGHGWQGNIEDARVVPNPVNLGSQQAEGDVNGIRPFEDDRILFLNIPGECTITIYTETGQLIKRIEHVNGTGDESWNLTTDSRQLLVSGIYIAVIEDPDGARVFRKFVVIR
ncbi:MAG TPA: T9SS type A sorting domain-containing protein, partial [Rhodothermales bacterium]|nr:T9SS type A sorting domain-containing protein [Rhodothermales bacterium]